MLNKGKLFKAFNLFQNKSNFFCDLFKNKSQKKIVLPHFVLSIVPPKTP